MKKVVITGVSGLLGPYVEEHMIHIGYDVLSVDANRPKVSRTSFLKVDLTNLGECYGALAGADAVIHLAAIPVAYSHPNEVTFQNNVMSTYNILEAAAGLGIKKVDLHPVNLPMELYFQGKILHQNTYQWMKNIHNFLKTVMVCQKL